MMKLTLCFNKSCIRSAQVNKSRCHVTSCVFVDCCSSSVRLRIHFTIFHLWIRPSNNRREFQHNRMKHHLTVLKKRSLRWVSNRKCPRFSRFHLYHQNIFDVGLSLQSQLTLWCIHWPVNCSGNLPERGRRAPSRWQHRARVMTRPGSHHYCSLQDNQTISWHMKIQSIHNQRTLSLEIFRHVGNVKQK